MARRACALLLKSVLAASGRDGRGLYDPITNVRSVFLGRARATAGARMVSWHETFHAFLNASTCHGVAMMMVGALASAGDARFHELLAELVESAINVHETYATVSGLAAAGAGVIDAGLLAGYPGYQAHLDAFEAAFPAQQRPVLSLMALTACARAAMQTPIYARLRQDPCAAWPDLDFDGAANPDQRFARLLGPDAAAAAFAAMDTTLLSFGPPLAAIAAPGMDADLERKLCAEAPPARLDAVALAGFQAFANVIEAAFGAPCGFDDQQHDLEALIAKVEAFAGAKLATRLVAASALGEAETAVFVDFRREVLELAPAQPASLNSLKTHDIAAAELFVLSPEGARYAQLVIMPAAKARALYHPIDEALLLDACADDLVVGLRRRWAPAGAAPRVEFFLLDAEAAGAVIAQLGQADIYVVASLSALSAPSWARGWILGDAGPAPRMAVLIDDDPFALINRHHRRGGALHISFLKTQLAPEAGAHTEVLCLAADDEPDVIYFTPCTTPMRQAVSEYARQLFDTVHTDGAFLARWLPMIGRVSAHVLREEGRFGDRFWLLPS